jgi:urea transport system ATP-binding protein
MLSIERLNVYYGESHILRNVGLVVPPGKVVCLMGRNGAGKTTLLKSIMGLLRPRNGRVSFDGEDITACLPEERARLGIGYVPQGREIFPHLSVRENLVLGLVARGGNGVRVPEEVFELFPILKSMLGRERAGDLSGGQQQQLAIARALVTDPRLLLLDEPTEGIQPSIISEIEDVIGRIKAEGKMSILLVEQYLEFAWRLADFYYIMEKGAVVAAGPGLELSEELAQKYLTV